MELRYYVTAGGGHVVEKEIRDAALTPSETARVDEVLRRVEAGDTLDRDVAKIRNAIWEIRVDGDRRIFRLYYAKLGGDSPILLALVFAVKKRRKADPKAIDRAEKRLADYRNRRLD